jgi:hypothetical protein
MYLMSSSKSARAPRVHFVVTGASSRGKEGVYFAPYLILVEDIARGMLAEPTKHLFNQLLLVLELVECRRMDQNRCGLSALRDDDGSTILVEASDAFCEVRAKLPDWNEASADEWTFHGFSGTQ